MLCRWLCWMLQVLYCITVAELQGIVRIHWYMLVVVRVWYDTFDYKKGQTLLNSERWMPTDVHAHIFTQTTVVVPSPQSRVLCVLLLHSSGVQYRHILRLYCCT